jgi:MoaA/NifB/PqqE/SkfB family radical SAM enzyme
MNLIIIRSCPNSCPYCFESSERKHTQKNLLELNDARILAEWIVKARGRSIGILGGEPFLHPHLREIIDIFKQECPAVPRMIFTGGLVKSKCFNLLKPFDAGLLFNVNETRDYPTLRKANQVIENVEMAIRRGFDVTLGFNVWRSDFDTTFMPQLAYDMGRTGFRWALANPMWGKEARIVRPDQFKELSQRCFEMMQNATKLDLHCTLDCHLPLCFFNDKQLAWLVRYQPQTVLSLGTCNPPLDVTPELEVIRCFSTSGFYRVRLLDFENESALNDHFRERIDNALQSSGGILPECKNCSAFNSSCCQGGCLGWSKVTEYKEIPNLANQIFKCLKKDKAKEALELVNNANRRFKTPLCLYLGAIAAQQLGDLPTAYRYSTQALYYTKDGKLKQKIIEFLKIFAHCPFSFENQRRFKR